MNRARHIGAAVLMTLGLFAAGQVPAADDFVVRGDAWLKSTPEMRKVFLIGAGNMISMEMAYAKKHGTPQPPAGTMTKLAVEGMSLDQLSERITSWYEAHPDRRDLPVMGVLWVDIVKPAAAK